MSNDRDERELKSAERRRFFELSGKFGVTAALAVAAAGTLGSGEAAAQTAREEQDREKAAKTTIVLATEYPVTADRSYPIMQLNLKENIQNFTSGEAYVKLQPAGALGIGTALASKLQSGAIQVGQFSVSNFSPFAPAVDLINIPYWANTNQRFVNLVTSKAWKDEVHPKVNANGFEILSYVVIDPRTVATRKGFGKVIKTPSDMQGMKFRVPASAALQQIYRLAGGNPTPVAWGETPTAIKEGVADGLDPALGALLVAGFRDLLESVTFTQQVEDAQVYAANLQWLKGVPGSVRDGVMQAAEVTFQQNLAQVPASRAYAIAEMTKAGVKFHVPTGDEMKAWEQTCGPQRPEWNEFKIKFAGSLAAFDKFKEAAEARAKYYVHDVGA